jgi:hypothetical protein
LRRARHDAIVAYAAERAGSGFDLDPDLEAAGIGADREASRCPGISSWLQPDFGLEVDYRGADHNLGVRSQAGPTVVELPGGASGLSKTSFAVCHQVTTLDRTRLTKTLSALSAEMLQEVERGLKAAMDLD